MTLSTLPQTDRVDVPAGTLSVPCPGCKRDVFYVSRASGVRMPIEITGPNTFAPSRPHSTTQHDGQGIAHLPHCHRKGE